jgi:hypothetical protein
MSHSRWAPPTPVNHNRYPSAPDGRGPSTVTRKTPVGKDPLAVEEGKPGTHPCHDKERA